MNTLKDDDVAINLKLLKMCHFYQIFDPSERMIFGWNIHQLCYIVCIGIVQCFIIYGNVGLIFKDEDIDEETDYFLITFTSLNIQLSIWRMFVYLYNANKVSDLFEVTRFDFFTSKQCVIYKIPLYNYCDKSRKYTNWYVIFSIVVIIQWFIFPIAINLFTTPKSSNVRFENILNLNFGASAQTYNQYFVIFYLMEAIIALCSMYSFIMTDLLLILFCSVLMYQQTILIQAFKNFGHEENPQTSNTNYIEEFKSILYDQVTLNLKIKSLFLVVKHIVLLTVACDSASIILLTYRFIMSFQMELQILDPNSQYNKMKHAFKNNKLQVWLKMEQDIALTLLKLGSTAYYISLELYIYCYLFDNMNIQRELVNFSIYSANWTQMDLKFKKLLLLAMRMNDANNLVIRATPKKIINLQIFASIMSMSYNVISVMLKITNTKNEISK